MKNSALLLRLFLSLLLFSSLLLSLSLHTVVAAELPQYSLKYDPSRNAITDGHAAIKLAGETNRRILIEVGGYWCKWCHVLDRFLNKHPKLKTQLHQTFVLLKVNVSEENYNRNFLKVFPAVRGYPHMFVTESNGKLLLSKDTGQFFNNHQYSVKRFEDFFERWATKKKSANG